MTHRAAGTFDVKVAPLGAAGDVPGRFSIDKQYHGDLEGSGKGEMLTAGDAASGSAGYVAIEQVTGKLGGKAGGFALQHSGTMTKGALQLTITIVPGSGTGELSGISGKMDIQIEHGKHSYVLEYSL